MRCVSSSTEIRKSLRRGFTLLEILIVMSIIAILVVAAFGVYQGILKTRKKALAVLQVQAIEEACRQYFEAFKVYPPDTDSYEPADQPPQGMSASQCKYSISRYLGTELLDRNTGQRMGPFLRDMNEKNMLGDPAEVD